MEPVRISKHEIFYVRGGFTRFVRKVKSETASNTIRFLWYGGDMFAESSSWVVEAVELDHVHWNERRLVRFLKKMVRELDFDFLQAESVGEKEVL